MALDRAVTQLLRGEAEVRGHLVVIEGRLDLRLELDLAVDLEVIDERLGAHERLAAALDRDARHGRAGDELNSLLAVDELEGHLVTAARLSGVLDGLCGGSGGRQGHGDKRRQTEECCGELVHAGQHVSLHTQLHRGKPLTRP
jgi:hypothetical protein